MLVNKVGAGLGCTARARMEKPLYSIISVHCLTPKSRQAAISFERVFIGCEVFCLEVFVCDLLGFISP
jgi:hypothetical protein